MADKVADVDLGVASGEPTENSIVLWTSIPKKFQPTAGSAEIECLVSPDPSFSAASIISKVKQTTNTEKDFTVRILTKGLAASTIYFYRFTTSNGYKSVTGRTKTAPAAGDNRSVRFAVVSCQDYSRGHFLSYKAIAAGDFDFILHLGDFIYEKGGTEVRSDIIGGGQARTLPDFRAKYRLYLTDPDLKEARRLFPFVHLWDDHEVENNYAGTDYIVKNPSVMEAGYRAFFEYVPVAGEVQVTPFKPAAPMTRALRFGANLELFALDQRQYRDPVVCAKDLLARRCDESLAVKRTMLGKNQTKWLLEKMATSSAKWKVIASELMVMPVRTPKIPFVGNNETALQAAQIQAISPNDNAQRQNGPAAQDANGLDGFNTWEDIARTLKLNEQQSRQLQKHLKGTVDEPGSNSGANFALENNAAPMAAAAASEPAGTFLTLDSWDGYPAERLAITEEIRNKNISNVVICSGDIHNFFAGKVHVDPDNPGSPVIASELTTSSITSKGIADFVGKFASTIIKPGISKKNQHIQIFDLKYHGHIEILVDANSVSGRMVAFESIAVINGKPFVLKSFGTQSGVPGFTLT